MSSRSLKRFSSIRCVSARTTLSRAKGWAKKAGISRVTDITPLDCLGLPVFASIRPRAPSSPVTYGKGLIPIDAQVGAYMEAIEYHFAEPKSDKVVTQWGTARDVAGAELKEDAILDYCPLFQTSIDLDAPLLLAVAHDLERGSQCLVPAELVYCPAPDIGQKLFGASTNGLASGNSLLEASIHALLELIERDIWSFEFLRDSSFLVDNQGLPAIVSDVLSRSAKAGLKLIIRYVPNDYGLAFFSAFLFDPEKLSAKFFNGGWGCHTNRNIALVRAVCEVAQSRLAFIHGARNFVKPPNIPGNSAQESDFLRKITQGVSNRQKIISYNDIPDMPITPNLEEQWQVVINCLRLVTDKPVYRVVYTPPDAHLQVVRLIVPSLEDCRETNMRIGYRLKAVIEQL